MPDYKTMYFRLFNRVTDAINILQSAQRECEDMFIDGTDADIFHLAERSESGGKEAE